MQESLTPYINITHTATIVLHAESFWDDLILTPQFLGYAVGFGVLLVFFLVKVLKGLLLMKKHATI
jgi:hypothetical protein